MSFFALLLECGEFIVNKKVAVIGVPTNYGQTIKGSELRLDAIRDRGLMESLESVQIDAVDIGNISVDVQSFFRESHSEDRNIKNLIPVKQIVERLAFTISGVVADGMFPLILGGDHSIAIGSIAGVAKHYKSLGVIWYDAHVDVNTPATSPSGNIYGMPLAVSMGVGHNELINIAGYCNKILSDNIVFVGVRDIDPGEQEFIVKRNIKTFTADDVKVLGIEKVMGETISYLSSRCDGVHLSFDIDALDPVEVCGVSSPADAGISLKDSMKAMELLNKHNIVTSAEFVEFNPLFDKDEKTVQAALILIQTLCRNRIHCIKDNNQRSAIHNVRI